MIVQDAFKIIVENVKDQTARSVGKRIPDPSMDELKELHAAIDTLEAALIKSKLIAER